MKSIIICLTCCFAVFIAGLVLWLGYERAQENKYKRSCTKRRIAATATAAETIWNSTGEMPKTVGDVVASASSNKTTRRILRNSCTTESRCLRDCYGKKLELRIVGDEIMVYSLGQNGIDDHGQHDDISHRLKLSQIIK